MNKLYFTSNETETHLHLEIEVPGYAKGDVEITLQPSLRHYYGGRIDIHAENSNRRSAGLSILFADNYDTEDLTASVEDGLLKITLPLKASKKSRIIPII